MNAKLLSYIISVCLLVPISTIGAAVKVVKTETKPTVKQKIVTPVSVSSKGKKISTKKIISKKPAKKKTVIQPKRKVITNAPLIDPINPPSSPRRSWE